MPGFKFILPQNFNLVRDGKTDRRNDKQADAQYWKTECPSTFVGGQITVFPK